MAATTVWAETRECYPKREEISEENDLGGSSSVSTFFQLQADSRASAYQAAAVHSPVAFK